MFAIHKFHIFPTTSGMTSIYTHTKFVDSWEEGMSYIDSLKLRAEMKGYAVITDFGKIICERSTDKITFEIVQA